MATKACNNCHEVKNLAAFERYGQDKYRNECKKCRTEKRKEVVKNAVKDPETAVLPKKCIGCERSHPDVTFQLRTDLKTLSYRPHCIECLNEGHAERQRQYAKRQREKDEEAYLEKNAKKMREYRKTHAEEISAWATKNTNRRLGAIQRQAKKKGILWDVNSMTRDVCDALMRSPCFYCGYLELDVTINGIDRLDSAGNYTIDNCKGACGPCNWSKRCLDPLTFVERCLHIHGVAWFPCAWPDGNSCTYADYRDRGTRENIPFELTPEQVDLLRNGNCTYCKKPATATHINGIDRIDSAGGYTIDNTCSACSECNYMKGKMSDGEFRMLCQKVAEYQQRGEIPVLPRQLYSVHQTR